MTTFYPTNAFPKTSVANGVTVVNLTPHAITVILPHKGDDSETVLLEASGYQVRVSTSSGGAVGTIGDWIEMFDRDTVGEVVLIDNVTKEVICPLSDIPERDDMVLLVSGMAGSHLRDRVDVFVPCTSPSDNPVRNEKGHIVAVRGIKKP
jgi:hypothetical protein